MSYHMLVFFHFQSFFGRCGIRRNLGEHQTSIVRFIPPIFPDPNIDLFIFRGTLLIGGVVSLLCFFLGRALFPIWELVCIVFLAVYVAYYMIP